MTTFDVSRDVKYWLDACRNAHRTRLIKRADGQEIPFEEGFANLANAVLRNKAPLLMDHLLGFQLLDKSEDNQQAVGVMAFDLNGQLVYGPIIFQGGRVKGTELLYLQNLDMIVPLQEPWVHYLLRKRNAGMGELVEPSMTGEGVSRPNLREINRRPKYASEWRTLGVPGLAAASNPLLPRDLLVPRLLKESAAAATVFCEWATSYRPFADAAVACYGPDILKTAMQTASTTGTLMEIEVPLRSKINLLEGLDLTPKAGPAVTVHTKVAADMADKIKEQLLCDRYAIDDQRPDNMISRLFVMDGNTFSEKRAEIASDDMNVGEAHKVSMQSVGNSGMYELVVKPNTLTRCAVFVHPNGEDGITRMAVAVEADGGRWVLCEPDELLGVADTENGALAKWVSGKSSSDLSVDGTYMFVSESGAATEPFEVTESYSDSGAKCYGVRFQHVYFPGVTSDTRALARGSADHGGRNTDQRPHAGGRHRPVEAICVDEHDGTKPFARGEMLYIPKSWKAIKLGADEVEGKDGLPACPSSMSDRKVQSSKMLLVPGTHTDFRLDVFQSTGKLALDTVGSQILVNGKEMSPVDAIVSLVCEHGLRENAAKQVVKEAQQAAPRWKSAPVYRIKYAQPYPLQRDAPNAPMPDDEMFMGEDPLFGSGMRSSFSGPQEMPIPGMEGEEPQPMSLEARPGPPQAQDVTQAAQSGQREVFDTAVLSSLVDSSRRESLVDRFLDDILTGMDRLGRILFNFWTHPEEFEEEFGSSDLVEIEDGLQNAFDATGKIVLKLKQQTADPTMYGEIEPNIGTFD